MKKTFPTKKNVNTTSSSNKSWLQRLKDESWEAELLVSTISIFGTFQLFGLIKWATNSFIDILPPNQYLVGYFIVFFGLLAISILIGMFVIHFFLRAYWVGLVGLNSVFPDYSVKDSVYSKIYTEKILSMLPKLKSSIHKVDELCSVIFSAAFTFLLIYMYMAISSSIYLLLFNLLSNYINSTILLIPLVLFIVMFTFQAIVSIIANLKVNKEKKWLQILSFKLVKTVSKIAYGPLYKSILQVSMIFGSNFKKKKSIVYLLFAFLISGSFISISQMLKTNIPYMINYNDYFDGSRVYSEYYNNENKTNTFLLAPEINSDKIKEKSIKLFIPVFNHERKMRKEICDTENLKNSDESKKEARVRLLKCYRKYHKVLVNGKKEEVVFMKYNHPRTKQFGLITHFKITNLKEGVNTLTVKKDYNSSDSTEWEIPFYYFEE
ncbi:hypothetical protein SAMN05444411_10195 [Lutibacter oricola]|uniref:Uncharacterized protein n=1 Tax=Lutibacter oricola TaxID=762486 RepID=A0A1H2QWC9_9FLAO|nr:hypothetical protein [Lutibacter oricola]SDW11502.1 hypothetical protein SAMN05444411_10195 [Lutibacter oricola]